MSDYRLRIHEIRGEAVVMSFTRWLESVQVRRAENQEVYLSFSSRFERFWLDVFGSNQRSVFTEYVSQKPTTWDCVASTLSACTVGPKNMSRSERSAFRWNSSEKSLGWNRCKMQKETAAVKTGQPKRATQTPYRNGGTDSPSSGDDSGDTVSIATKS